MTTHWKQVEPAPPVTLDMVPEGVACVVGYGTMEWLVRMRIGRDIWTVGQDGRKDERTGDNAPSSYTVLSRLDGQPLPEVEVPLSERTQGVWYEGLNKWRRFMFDGDNVWCWNHELPAPRLSNRPVGNIKTTGPGYERVEDAKLDDLKEQCEAIMRDATDRLRTLLARQQEATDE